MPETITFDSQDQVTTPLTQTVYLRERWSDVWVEEKHLYADTVTWEVSPGMPTATLYWSYGEQMRPGDQAWQTIARLEKDRWYVKIEITDGNDPMYWFGQIADSGDLLEGTNFDGSTGIAYGKQQLVCYGLERILEQQVMRSSRWFNSNTFEEGDIERALVFNDRGVGNRSATFPSKFAQLKADATDWSSYHIALYLLEHQKPLDPNGVSLVPIRLGAGASLLIPDWDKPVLQQEGRNLRQLLDAVLSRHRLLSYYLDVDETATPHEILVKPFSFTRTAIAIEGADVLNANARVKDLVFDRDPSAEAALRTATVDGVEQVEVRGARRRSCFTLSLADATIEAGWPTALKTEYDAAASGAADYPVASQIMERQRRNAEARSSDRLETVYSRFQIPAAWDFLAGNGLGNGTDRPVFPDDDDATIAITPYLPEMYLLARLPLLDGHDYSGSNIGDDTVTELSSGPFEEMLPLVVAPIVEDPTRYVQLERIGEAAREEETGTGDTDRLFSLSVRVPLRDKAIVVHVHGQQQHVIAKTDWSPVDTSDDAIDKWDWRDFVFTVALEDDRYCAAKFPDPVTGELDFVRALLINAGEDFRLDYVVPDTVVAIDPTDGSLVRSDGGHARDDRPALKRVAKLAYQWYSQSRKTLEFATGEWVGSSLESGVWLGDMIFNVGDSSVAGSHQQVIDTPITQIQVSLPRGVDGQPGPFRVAYTTAFGQFDPLKVIL